MTTTMAQIIAGLVTVEERVTGIKKGHNEPPNNPEPLPCFVNLVGDGDLVTPRMMGTREWTHRIQAIAVVAHETDLVRAERIIRPLITGFVEQLDQDKTLGGLGEIIEAAVTRYRRDPIVFRGAEGQEIPFVGVWFDVQVVQIETGVLYA